MAENVQTGGVMQFSHEGESGKLDNERKKAIEQGYREAEERKRKEKKRRLILWIVVALVVTGVILAIAFLRKS